MWGMPIVNFHAMREGLKKVGVGYNDVAYQAKLQTWKLQFTTNNATTPYVHIFWNVSAGPVVVELPAVVGTGVGLFGNFLDAWQRPLDDVGNDGLDHGNGGKFLILPPNYQGEVPAGYIPLRQETNNGFAVLRMIIGEKSPAELSKMEQLVKKIQVYPLAQADNPPATRHIDIHDKLVDGIVRYDDSFFDGLNDMIQEEPIETKDLAMMGLLRSIGISKGLPFQPAKERRRVLLKGVAEARDYMFSYLFDSMPRFYGAGRHWINPVARSATQTAFNWLQPGYLDVDERAVMYRIAYTGMKRLGASSLYLASAHDSQGKRLDGAQSYKLNVPGNAPIRNFWSVTAYEDESAAWFRDVARANIDSLDKRIARNPDGSVDVYFGPQAPKGMENNWIPTVPGKTYFLLFRFYGPKKAVFDRSFKLDDLEPIHP